MSGKILVPVQLIQTLTKAMGSGVLTVNMARPQRGVFLPQRLAVFYGEEATHVFDEPQTGSYPENAETRKTSILNND